MRASMKYKLEDYVNSGFYSDMDDPIEHHKERVVKCRKSHQCVNCQNEIQIGEHALLETGFLDGEPVSSYTCLHCIEEWLDESE